MMTFRPCRVRKNTASGKSTLVTFCLLFACVLMHSGWAETKQSAMQQYPPYPYVWYRRLPGPKFEHRYLEVFSMEDGDYLITYDRKITHHKDGSPVYGGLYFFSGRVVDGLHRNNLVPPKYKLIQSQLQLTLPQG